MTIGAYIERRVGFLAILFVSIIFLGACSMQKSGSKVDSTRADASCKTSERSSRDQLVQEKKLLKIDYLTPLCSLKNPEVYVYKEKRRLYIIDSDVLVRDYPVGLGFNPKGDKERMGDGRTPEGNFYICIRNSNSRFAKSLGLSYPNQKHAERAVFSGLISPGQFRDILMAFERRSAPPWNTVLGGEIFIHAGGAHRDWTDGCVALYDSDMEELFNLASVGTQVTIRP